MNSVTDPWASQYERLMDILKSAEVSKDLSPRVQKKILVLHKSLISQAEFEEAISLFKYLYKGEI